MIIFQIKHLLLASKKITELLQATIRNQSDKDQVKWRFRTLAVSLADLSFIIPRVPHVYSSCSTWHFTELTCPSSFSSVFPSCGFTSEWTKPHIHLSNRISNPHRPGQPVDTEGEPVDVQFRQAQQQWRGRHNTNWINQGDGTAVCPFCPIVAVSPLLWLASECLKGAGSDYFQWKFLQKLNQAK